MSFEYEPVIGLEVHVQLSTESKIFSSSKARLKQGESVANVVANQNANEIDAAHPGSLPAFNQKALEYAIRAGLATGCKINLKNQFARKHYFYPDSPKGYQISQFDEPLCEQGFLKIAAEGDLQKKIGITRIHMEEDAGKSTHHSSYSLINFNRAGVPLIEVVSEPDLRSPQEAVQYLKKLYSIVTFLEICDGNLQEGNFRCDANVSVRLKGESKLGTRTEIKNINSFRFVEKAIDFEIQRQIQTLLSGGKIIQETRLYDSDKNQTISMRSKEEAEDYRYFPDPDLPPILLDQKWVDQLQASIPELPDAKMSRYQKDWGLSHEDAEQLTQHKPICLFFEESVAHNTQGAKIISNLLNGEWLRLLQEEEIPLVDSVKHSKLRPLHVAALAKAFQKQEISATAAKQVLIQIYQNGTAETFQAVDEVVLSLGLKQVNDTEALEKVIDEVMTQNPSQVQEFLSGKEKVIGFLVGQAMKKMAGKANPALLQDLMRKKIKERQC